MAVLMYSSYEGIPNPFIFIPAPQPAARPHMETCIAHAGRMYCSHWPFLSDSRGGKNDCLGNGFHIHLSLSMWKMHRRIVLFITNTVCLTKQNLGPHVARLGVSFKLKQSTTKYRKFRTQKKKNNPDS